MKKQRLNVILVIFVCAALLFCLYGCIHTPSGRDIVILFTNDVHCGIDDNIGYAGLAQYKAEALERTPNVTLVDCGDAIQGGLIGTVSSGLYPVQIMNEVGYDFAIFGNHEFDYGMDRLQYLVGEADAQYLACNIVYTGSEENKLADVKPYSIVNYGDRSVAYIGVSTPESLVKSTPTYFMENGEYVYDFLGHDPEVFYNCVQEYIYECQSLGADYIVVLSHLGIEEASEPYRSVDLIKNTSGIDVLLDGHSHSVIPCQIVSDKNSDDVKLASTGTKFQYIGELVITNDGTISLGIVSDYSKKNTSTESFINTIKASYEEEVNKIVASSDVDLLTTDSNGIRLVRNRETAIGNLCADAYRAVAGADIGFINGGGIRADIKKGNISYADIIAVHPYGNTLCMVKTTGAKILDALELSNSYVKSEYTDGAWAIGEDGGFLSVAGLKFEVDTSIPTSVKLDENGMFLEVAGERRVKNVKVLENGEYVDIDPEKTYTVACHNYLLKSAGNGYNMFLNDELLIDEGMIDNQVLITYIKDHLNGVLSEKYSAIEGRIIIK